MISFWEREMLQRRADLIIIGAGIVGLHAAIFYKRARPQARVVVLERSNFSYGASTRNAGFACFGSPSELLAELKESSEAEVWDIVERRWKGLLRLRQEHGDEAIGFEHYGGYELFDEANEKKYRQSVAALAHFNEALLRISGEDKVYGQADEQLAMFGFGAVNHLIKNRLEGQIDSGALMQLLLKKAAALGIEIYNGVEVIATDSMREGADVILHTKGWHGAMELELRATKVAVCTNAFAERLLGEIDIIPARAQVLITEPIPALQWQGTFHYDEGYYYFRNVGQRILLGGARNSAFNEERSDEIILTSNIQQILDSFLSHVIRPQQDYKIDMRWSGIMGMGEQHLLPKIEYLGKGIFVAARCNGMGVAMGIQTAADLNDLLISH